MFKNDSFGLIDALDRFDWDCWWEMDNSCFLPMSVSKLIWDLGKNLKEIAWIFGKFHKNKMCTYDKKDLYEWADKNLGIKYLENVEEKETVVGNSRNWN